MNRALSPTFRGVSMGVICEYEPGPSIFIIKKLKHHLRPTLSPQTAQHGSCSEPSLRQSCDAPARGLGRTPGRGFHRPTEL